MTPSYLLALDIDGTLTREDGSISQRTIDVVRRCQTMGFKLCLASGRPPVGILPIARLLGMEEFGGYIIGFNGAHLVDFVSGDVLYSATLPDEALPILAECARRPGHTILTYTPSEILTEDASDPYVFISHTRNGLPIRQLSDFLLEAPRPLAKCIITGDPCSMPALQRELSARLFGIADTFLSDAFFLETVQKGVDKATALSSLLDILGLTHSRLIAAGDGHNDIGMIRLASTGIAMANAHPDVRRIADIVAPPASQNGLAQTLEAFLSSL